MITIIHNPRCGKSREGLKYLKEKQVEFEIREYLKNPLKKVELKDILKKLNFSADDLLRKKETIYKELIKGNPNPNEDTLINWMLENPKLIERPIIINEQKAIVARVKEKIDDIL